MPTCKYGQLTAQVTADIARMSTADTYRHLVAIGQRLGTTTIKSHRAGTCGCVPTGTAPRVTRLQRPALNVMTLDIERLPGRAKMVHRGLVIEGDFWDLSGWKSVIGYRIPPTAVLEWPRTICAAWRFYGSKRTEFASEWGDGPDDMLRRIWDAYDQADVIYGHNVARFDTKHLNTGWRDLGLPPPSPHKPMDTLAEFRKVFGDESMQLAALTQRLGIGSKTDKYDVAVARAACAGHKPSQRRIQSYNVGDIDASEGLVDAGRGWIPSHPHDLNGVSTGVPTCNQCWGDSLEPNGERLADLMAYPLFRCQDCGANVQGRNGRRVAETRGVR